MAKLEELEKNNQAVQVELNEKLMRVQEELAVRISNYLAYITS